MSVLASLSCLFALLILSNIPTMIIIIYLCYNENMEASESHFLVEVHGNMQNYLQVQHLKDFYSLFLSLSNKSPFQEYSDGDIAYEI